MRASGDAFWFSGGRCGPSWYSQKTLNSALLICAILFSLLITYGQAANPSHHTVNTKYGQLTGRVKTVTLTRSDDSKVEKKIVSFLSVPFAQPPTGRLRFKAPLPVNKWNENRQAFISASPCPQPRDATYPGFWGAEMWNYKYPPYEDCLKLNMWYPLDIKNASVLVWIFGGGFTTGSPGLDVYNGEGLAGQGDVIVININYRVGAFGFLYLDHPDAPGNVGLLDQRMALKWIQENIASFGGNPGKVTIFGESAGAASVVAHMIAPESRDLFQYGILQSGSLQNPWAIDTKERALNKSLSLASLVGCPKGKFETFESVIRCLEKTEIKKIVDNTWMIPLKYFMEFPLVIVREDKNFFLDEQGNTFDALQYLRDGNFKKTNIIVGVNKDEGTFWMNYLLEGYFGKDKEIKTSRDEYQKRILKVLNREKQVFQMGATNLYNDAACTIKGGTKSDFFTNALNQAVGDTQFTCDSLYFIDRLTKTNSTAKAYLYFFEHRPSSTPWPKWMGVIHGYEIEIIFGIPLVNQTHTMGNYTKAERKLSENMIEYWKTFAETGQPAQSHEWHPASWKNKPHLILSTKPVFQKDSLKQRECKFWNEVRGMEYKLHLHEHSTSGGKKSNSTFWLILLFVVML